MYFKNTIFSVYFSKKIEKNQVMFSLETHQKSRYLFYYIFNHPTENFRICVLKLNNIISELKIII